MMVNKSMGARLAKFYGQNFRDESGWSGEETVQTNERRGSDDSSRKLFGIEEEMVPSGGEVNELDVQIYRFADMMSKVQFKGSPERRASGRELPQLVGLQQSGRKGSLSPSSRFKVKRSQLERDASEALGLKQKLRDKEGEREKQALLERKQLKERNVAALDNIIEVHFLMKMYQSTSGTMGPHGRIAILNSIWTKLMSDEGRLQDYIRFLYEEVMKFVVCRDEELMKLMGRSLEQGRTTKAVTFLEMVEMLRSETDTKIQNDQMEMTSYQNQIKELNGEMARREEEWQLLVKSLQEGIADLKTQFEQQKFEYSFCGLEQLGFKDQELRQMNYQLDMVKETSFKAKERFDFEKVGIQNRYDDLVKAQGGKIFQLEGRVEQLVTINSRLELKLSEVQHKFETAFHSLKFANQRIKEAEKARYESESERSLLAVRAASSFSELTPRPDMTDAMTLLGLESEMFFRISTKEKVELLTSNIERKISKLKSEKDQLQNQLVGYQKQKLAKKQTPITSKKSLSKSGTLDEIDLHTIQEVKEQSS